MFHEVTVLQPGEGRTHAPAVGVRLPGDLGGLERSVTVRAEEAESAFLAALAAVHVGWVSLRPRAEEPYLRAEFSETCDR